MSDNRDGFSLIDDTAVSRTNKFNESADDFESHSIGNLLPDEEDLLTVMIMIFLVVEEEWNLTLIFETT